MWASYHAPSVGPLTTLSDTAIYMLLPQRLIGPSCYSSILDARTLSPAVCPSNWIYHSVRAQGGYTTTASCCARYVAGRRLSGENDWWLMRARQWLLYMEFSRRKLDGDPA
jgi:hypothetical protein